MTPEPDHKAGFTPRRARWKLLLVTAAVFALAAGLVLLAITLFGYEAVRHGWDQAQPFIIAVKWGGMFVLIWRWRDVIHWAAHRWNIGDAWRDWALGLRWRFAAALVLLEIIFGQNLLAYVL